MPSPPFTSPQVQLSAKFEFLGITFFGAVETGGKTTTILAESRKITFNIDELVRRAAKEVDSELVPPPVAVSDLPIEKLGVCITIDTEINAKSFTFFCHAKFPINDRQPDILVTLAVTKQKRGYWIDFGGKIMLQPAPDHTLAFKLQFSKDPQSTLFSASCSQQGGQPVKIRDLVSAVSTDLAQDMPPDLAVDLKNIFFLYQGGGEAKFLFGLILESIDLSGLELVRDALPADQKLSISNLQFLVASEEFSPEELSEFLSEAGESSVSGGLVFSAELQLGTEVYPLDLPLGGAAALAKSSRTALPAPASAVPAADGAEKVVPDQAAPATGADQGAKWFEVQKSVGPVRFRRVGAKFTAGKLWLLLDTTLAMGPVAFSLNGLGVGSRLNKFAPEFTLSGLGLHMKTPAFEIGGALLREVDAENRVSYSGMTVLKLGGLAVSGMGSYQPGPPSSLFVYAFLDMPLGGPPFLFVTGLAAGFGYNRRFIMPEIDQMADFPLVRFVMDDSSGNDEDPLETLNNANTFLPPAPGQYFLSVGLEFSSFNIINSFLLLTVSFGDRLEIRMLGLSTLVCPPSLGNKKVTPIAKVTLAIRAQLLPEEGFLAVEAKLTEDSYILSRDCRLTGGFAFYTWFKGNRAGDFILTLGGYHPRFQRPSHYPTVDPLGVRWKVTEQLQIKGSVYFALCSHALMVGGRLETMWQSGSIRVWFVAAVDFLIPWQPYCYDARLQVSIGGAYTKKTWIGTITKSFDIGADLHIWGPEFSGKASIKVVFISVAINFGTGKKQPPQPISWDDFKTSFLPEDDKVCSISVTGGLIRTVKDEQGSEICVVNPQEFALLTESVIPSTRINGSSKDISAGSDSSFGIGSMGIKEVWSSEQTIRIRRITEGSRKKITVTNITCSPVHKNVPEALWGDSLQPDLNGKKFRNALTGCAIRPHQAGRNSEQPASVSINTELLADKGTTRIAEAFGWVFIAPSPQEENRTWKEIDADIRKEKPERQELLTSFLPDLQVDVDNKPEWYTATPKTKRKIQAAA
ncbi:MAG: DUF6603 domain-containing protein [Candidatus Electrothrix sp. YB6]